MFHKLLVGIIESRNVLREDMITYGRDSGVDVLP